MNHRQKTPRLPAEWEPQRAIMLTWPHPDTDWADLLETVEGLYLRLAEEITRRQDLLLVCPDALCQRKLAERLQTQGIPLRRVFFAQASGNDTWTRDHGPVTVLEGDQAVLTDFRFNGWGGKHASALDDAITRGLHEAGVFDDTPMRSPQLVLEGGALETDGRNTLLTTRSAVLDPKRNPGLNAGEMERRFAELLGIQRVLWLDHGRLSGDDTDGHIDTLARFADPETILYATAHDHDPDAAELRAMAAELEAFRSADGRPYRLVPLPPIEPIYDPADGRRLPASYANFLIINGAVLAPIYGDAADEQALRTLTACFAQRTVTPLDCRALITQHGSLHCITMQLPQALPLTRQEPA